MMSGSGKSQADGKPKVFFGELQCQARHASGQKANQQCTNKAYFRQEGRYLCGVHSNYNRRTKLKKNPNADKVRQEKIQNLEEQADAAKIENQKAGKAGKLICSKMGMRRSPDDVPGFLKVFPNNKHQNRKDGFGCASLSPMQLGPVEHGQKDLPPAKLLENYHQFNKVHNVEVDDDREIKPIFYKQQLSGYKSGEGQRHKYTSKSKLVTSSKVAKLRTLFSIHKDKDGKETRYTYLESRYFYCHFYEKLVEGNEDLQKLRTMLSEGMNLQIVGYDGYEVTKDLATHYEDTARPFGHEMVLYTLLTEQDPKKYPWNQYYEKHTDRYPVHLKPWYLQQATMVTDGKKRPVSKGKSDEEETKNETISEKEIEEETTNEPNRKRGTAEDEAAIEAKRLKTAEQTDTVGSDSEEQQ